MLKFVKKLNPTGKHDLYLETSGLDIPNEKEIEPLKLFCIKTYSKLYSRKHRDGWVVNFAVVNSFLESLTCDEQSKIVMAFVAIHHKLITYMRRDDISDIQLILNESADILFGLDKELDLLNRIEKWCVNNLPIGTMKNAGNRAQDTDIMTWFKPDVIKLTAIVVLSKIFAPLYGTFMFYIKDQKGVDNKLKQLHASVLINKILVARCPSHLHKLRHMISHYMKREFDENMSAICTGLTSNTMLDMVQACLFVRYFVNVDLYYPNGNLITYVRVNIRNAIYGQQNPNNKNMVMLRQEIGYSGSEESRKSQLEWDSLSSSTTADVPVLISSSVDNVVGRIMHEMELDEKQYESNLTYYIKHPIELHIVNKFLLNMYFGQHVGGAKSISALRANDVIRLMSLLQLILLSIGFKELAYILTANIGSLAKASHDSHDIRLKNAYRGSTSFKNYRSKLEGETYPISAPKVFEQVMSDIATAITRNMFIYNLAPTILETIETEEAVNGKGVVFTNEFIPDICHFIDLL